MQIWKKYPRQITHLIIDLKMELSTDFTHSSGVSISDFEQVNADSIDELYNGIYFGTEQTCTQALAHLN